MGSAPAHHLGTIIMKFLLVVALVVAADAFVLPSSYLVDRPVPDHSVLVHDGLHLQPVQVPGVPALFASPPVKREKRQTEDEKVVEDEQIDVEYEEDEDEDVNADPAYIGVPFGALSLNIGSAYGALALYRPGSPYGALGRNVVLPYAALQPPFTPPTGCNNPFGWNIPCTNLNIEQEDGAET